MNCKHHLDISIKNINLMLLMILCLMNYFPSFLGKFLLVVTQNASHTKLKNQYLKNDVLKLLLLHLAENRSKHSGLFLNARQGINSQGLFSSKIIFVKKKYFLLPIQIEMIVLQNFITIFQNFGKINTQLDQNCAYLALGALADVLN